MSALGRLWTWVGHLFIPFAFGIALFTRNGLFTQYPPPLEVRVSYAYFGLLLTITAGAVLVWTFALYVRAAKANGVRIIIPPNTTFEEITCRNPIVSVITIAIFLISIIVSLITFGTSYSESNIYRWDDQQPLTYDFYQSRVLAHEQGCRHQPCYAVGQRMGANRIATTGVVEYILYITDGALIVLSAILVGGIFYTLFVLFFVKRKPFI